MTRVPDPLVPPNCDLRDVEPPWETFVAMAMSSFDLSRATAEAMVEELKAEHRRHRQ